MKQAACDRPGYPHLRPAHLRRRTCADRSAFSLVEALVAFTLLAVAGSVLLLATEGIINTSQESHERMLAQGLARQLLDEITNRPLRPSSADAPRTRDPTRRVTFATIWDYDGYHASPPVDRWGIPCGQGDDAGGRRPAPFRAAPEWYAGMERRVAIRYVDPDDLTAVLTRGTTSDMVRITVQVVRIDSNGAERPLAQQDRIVSATGLGGW